MNTEVINDQVGEIRVLSWNINGLGNKMADPDLLAFIREYDIIFLTETMKSNDHTLVLPGYQFHHVSRTFKNKNVYNTNTNVLCLLGRWPKSRSFQVGYKYLIFLGQTKFGNIIIF